MNTSKNIHRSSTVSIRLREENKWPRKTISAIVVNLNGQTILDDCIRTLRQQTHQCHEIVLVDNGSTDDSVRIVKEKYPEVKIVQCKTNLGYAEGNNVGCKAALGEYVALVNTDARLEPDCLERLSIALSHHSDLAIIQGKVLQYHSPSLIDSTGSFLTPTGFLYHRQYGREDAIAMESYVFSTKGVCTIIPRAVFHRLGGYDSDFFAYFEESDFCWRAWNSGYKVMFVPSSIVYHMGGATSGRLPRDFIDFHSFKNRICSIMKNCETRTLLFMLPVHVALCLAIIVGFMIRGQRRRGVGILKALIWNARNLSSTLRKRSRIQSELRRVNDRIVFRYCMVWPGLSYFKQLLGGYGA